MAGLLSEGSWVRCPDCGCAHEVRRALVAGPPMLVFNCGPRLRLAEVAGRRLWWVGPAPPACVACRTVAPGADCPLAGGHARELALGLREVAAIA